MPSPIIARADALMQRRRQQGAPPEPEEVPVLTDAFGDDDIPVLLDIANPAGTGMAGQEPVTGASAAPQHSLQPQAGFAPAAPATPAAMAAVGEAPPPPAPPKPAPPLPAPATPFNHAPLSRPALASDVDEILLRELARRVEQRLHAEIPKIIASTVRELLAEQTSTPTTRD